MPDQSSTDRRNTPFPNSLRERKREKEREKSVCVCVGRGQGYILGEGQRYWENGKNEEEILIKVNNQYRLKYESSGFLHINQGVSLGHSLTCCQNIHKATNKQTGNH